MKMTTAVTTYLMKKLMIQTVAMMTLMPMAKTMLRKSINIVMIVMNKTMMKMAMWKTGILTMKKMKK